MFCYQCEQTAFGTGCKVQGVCGKKEETSNLQDELTNSLINLALSKIINKETTFLMVKGLFTTVTNVNFENNSIQELINEINSKIPEEQKNSFTIKSIYDSPSATKSLKSLILLGLRGISAYCFHARVLGFECDKLNSFFFEALSEITKDLEEENLMELVLKTGKMNFKCMELLDKANSETFGKQQPTDVSKNIEKGPFIIVSGHDLYDLKLLLEQTKDKGINIYTHGEMLVAHAYPELKKYPHLKGNFGTAWQNQQREFDNVPAPILFTTNCIMPPKDSYKDRVFTTNVVNYPDTVHVCEKKDFSSLINKALELKGYDKVQNKTGINGGDKLKVGYSHHFVLEHKEKLINLIKEKKINHIFLVGGCDGAKPGRNYYTEFVEKTPKDSIILTLACGKYRFNDLDLGEIEGIPRLLDMGQCNDAYSAIMVSVELAKEMNCSVDELPLSIVLSWYEQKAVAVLLTLLYLNIKKIYLGPSLPAFISSEVLEILSEKYKLRKIDNVDNDLKEMLA